MYFALVHSNVSHSPLEPLAPAESLILRLEQVVSIAAHLRCAVDPKI